MLFLNISLLLGCNKELGSKQTPQSLWNGSIWQQNRVWPLRKLPWQPRFVTALALRSIPPKQQSGSRLQRKQDLQSLNCNSHKCSNMAMELREIRLSPHIGIRSLQRKVRFPQTFRWECFIVQAMASRKMDKLQRVVFSMLQSVAMPMRN